MTGRIGPIFPHNLDINFCFHLTHPFLPAQAALLQTISANQTNLKLNARGIFAVSFNADQTTSKGTVTQVRQHRAENISKR